jgi:pyruvate formate lyase activating enzyme
VADWVCAGSRQPGWNNLAVFYASCTLNCLFCQNWNFRPAAQSLLRASELFGGPGLQATDREHASLSQRGLTAAELAEAADPQTFCVCFFGGDPASQMPHALGAAVCLAKRGVAICWETAGTSHPKLLERAVQLSLETGGCIKFDLKAYREALHVVLTGASNRRTLENFARAARRSGERPEPPLVIASTLLVPGYVDAEEVGLIAQFIAHLNPEIPYSLLGFGPHFYMNDLPRTSVGHARAAEAAARAAGLTNVHIGNRHLLSRDY